MCLAIPARLVSAGPETATVEIDGVRRVIGVALVEEPLEPGDWVLVHVGFALAKIDEAEAQATLDLLEQAGQAYLDELDAWKDLP
jgi:hydrogenase expression/formation protein HypC